jgi:hypothetical protein
VGSLEPVTSVGLDGSGELYVLNAKGQVFALEAQ